VITRLRLTNFKAWRELGVRFAPVTGIFGANSAGKSSLIQFLLLLNLKKDAKFLAVAVKADAAIVNALDSDWNEHRELTNRLGVEVRQLCPQHANRSKASSGDHASR